MQLSEILVPERIVVDRDGVLIGDKRAAIGMLAKLLADAVGVSELELNELLLERERLQSTGIGDKVAIPHASVDVPGSQAGALLLCPKGLEFDAIDGAPVTIVFGLVGPRRSTGEHLKALARISRLLRSPTTRAELLAANDAADAFAKILAEEAPVALG
ncbi:MAG: PTS sugar transporter subunit IIA [Polyangiaceae bacterium]|nr:PTS sugar transporter subunit IIA [Polyangiaceae bacterium]